MSSNRTIADNLYCCVPQCFSKGNERPLVVFHRFPTTDSRVDIVNAFGIKNNVSRRDEWKRVLKIGKPISNRMDVCSKHFEESDYTRSFDAVVKRRRLNADAVPSQNLPLTSHSQPEKKMERSERKKQETQPGEEDDGTIDDIADTEARDVASEALLLLSQFVPPEKYKEVATQVKSGDLAPLKTFNLSSVSPNEMNSLTGIKSFELLNEICSIISEEFNDESSHNLSIKEQVVMTLMRVKINVSFAILAIFFKCSQTTCKNVFVDIITILAHVMKDAIPWPSKDEILSNMPQCFDNFKHVRIVLDCTEISVAKPKCLTCRINSYSRYKGGHTIKLLAGVSPAGLIVCHSKAYGGRASDKHILMQSGMLDMLEPYVDAIMIDKGFLVEDVCSEYGIAIVRPPFLKGGRFSAHDAEQNRKIARARVHVERVFQRVKQFQMLATKVPWNLVPFIDEIVCTVFGLVNLNSSILSEERF